MGKTLSELALAGKAEKAKKLDKIKPVILVKDTEHARSQEVINYVLSRLSQGAHYDVIRRELGVSDSGVDHRWRIIRTLIFESIVPETSDQALRENHAELGFWISKMESHLARLDEEIEKCTETCKVWNDKKKDYEIIDSKLLAQLHRIKADTLKNIVEYKNRYLQDYIKLEFLKKNERSTGGTSIIIMNNIPRPGQNEKDVAEARQKVITIKAETAEAKKNG